MRPAESRVGDVADDEHQPAACDRRPARRRASAADTACAARHGSPPAHPRDRRTRPGPSRAADPRRARAPARQAPWRNPAASSADAAPATNARDAMGVNRDRGKSLAARDDGSLSPPNNTRPASSSMRIDQRAAGSALPAAAAARMAVSTRSVLVSKKRSAHAACAVPPGIGRASPGRRWHRRRDHGVHPQRRPPETHRLTACKELATARRARWFPEPSGEIG